MDFLYMAMLVERRVCAPKNPRQFSAFEKVVAGLKRQDGGPLNLPQLGRKAMNSVVIAGIQEMEILCG